jgi:hypothetical protein
VLTEAVTALASAGGSALATAMVTGGCEGVQARFADLFGRGDAKQADRAAGWLEQSWAALAGLSGPGLEWAQVEQEIIWRTRLGDLLEQDPDAETELRALVAQVQAQVISSGGQVEQHAARWLALGPDHADTLNTRHNLAAELAERGDHAAAEAQWRDVLADRLRIQGPDHPDTLATRQNIAWVL